MSVDEVCKALLERALLVEQQVLESGSNTLEEFARAELLQCRLSRESSGTHVGQFV